MLSVKSDFDGGNIDVVKTTSDGHVDLRIKPDGQANFLQWFHFRVTGAATTPLTMNIMNAGDATYLRGWEDYRAVASYDGDTWFRVDTDYRDGVLTIRHTPDQNAVNYAYFAAYPSRRVFDYLAEISKSDAFDVSIIGQTNDGQDIPYLCFGGGDQQFWIIARQHPGESMGSWWMEGFFAALADRDNTGAQTLSSNATLNIIPCMNLDGVRRGHLRTNARGVDLNRAWRNTTAEMSPEVFLVRRRMQETGVDFFLDVHGDEAIPNNFLDGPVGIPSWNEQLAHQFKRYSDLLLGESKDFQTDEGYPAPKPGQANLDIATNYVAETWGCLAMTLEMPFKDANNNPDPVFGWSPQRCRNFAREHLNVMAKIVTRA